MIYNKPVVDFNFSSASSFQLAKVTYYNEKEVGVLPLTIFPYGNYLNDIEQHQNLDQEQGLLH